MQLLEQAIADIFDVSLYDDLKETESQEREVYRRELKDYVESLSE